MNTPLPDSLHQLSTHNRLVLASARDRARLEKGPLNGITLFVDQDADVGVLRNVFPLLGVAVSSGGEAEIKRAFDAIRSIRSIPELPTVRLEPDNVDAGAALIRDVLQGSVWRLANFTTSITAELAMLRRQREVLLENYRALEDAFRARNWEATTEVFAHDPFVDPKDEGIGHLLRDTGVEQLFPVSSYALSGFALHFRKPIKESGEFIVRLDYVESDETVAEWAIPFANIVPNWNFFSLPKACDGSARTLRLRLSATGGDPPEPSLGHPILNERYAAHASVDHGDLDHRPLAFRIFTGLPGVRPTAIPTMFAPNSAVSGPRTENYRLPAELLRTVTNVSVTPIVPSFQTVHFLDHEGAVVCHPLPEGISAGAIGGAVAPGTVQVSARALIDHPQGQPAAVGFLLAPATADLRAEIAELGQNGGARRSTIFSGWRSLTPEQPININLQLDAPVPETMTLIVVSRATTGSVDYSWLKVFDLRFVRQVGARA